MELSFFKDLKDAILNNEEGASIIGGYGPSASYCKGTAHTNPPGHSEGTCWKDGALKWQYKDYGANGVAVYYYK